MFSARKETRIVMLAVAVWLPAFLATGCSDIEVGSVWAPQSAAHPLGLSFAWVSEADPRTDDLQGVQPALRDLLRQTIDQGLMAKGYRKGPAQEADFWLRAKVTAATRGDAYAVGTFEEYQEGTLVVYMIDPASEQWLWRGWASARLQENNPPQEKRDRLQKAVQMMLKNLPGSGKPSGNQTRK